MTFSSFFWGQLISWSAEHTDVTVHQTMLPVCLTNIRSPDSLRKIHGWVWYVSIFLLKRFNEDGFYVSPRINTIILILRTRTFEYLKLTYHRAGHYQSREHLHISKQSISHFLSTGIKISSPALIREKSKTIFELLYIFAWMPGCGCLLGEEAGEMETNPIICQYCL